MCKLWVGGLILFQVGTVTRIATRTSSDGATIQRPNTTDHLCEADMSAMGERATQARSGIGDLETALERTDKVLAAAEKADEVASGKGRTFLKLLLALTVIGVTVLVIRKLVEGGSPDPEPDRSPTDDS